MTAPDRIRATWYATDDVEMPKSLSALTPASRFWDTDPHLVEYVRADLAAPQSWDDVNGTKHVQFPTTPLAEALAVPTEAILQALADHNDLLRSAAAIAGRGVLEGEGVVATANWDAFYNRVKVVLKRHHETTNAARAALRAIGEGRADG